jgi:hypothetical protein
MANHAPASEPAAARIRPAWVIVLFLAAAGFHLWGATHGWHHADLIGNEFRQTHTAISAYHIQRDRDFSLAYPVPVMGKPWSVPSEFPLYQWTVVLVSDTFRLPLQESGRLVSLLCFYLSLPAVFLLLRRAGLRPVLCLIPVSLILACPLYIFYARAFLIETMALMFGLWYAVALARGAEHRSIGWLVVINLAGLGAGLVKVTTFLVFVGPAFLWSLVLLWRAWPRAGRSGWGSLLRTLGWLAAAHAVPFAATLWWIHFADAIKALNPTGYYLRSDQLRAWNFGYGKHLDPETWRLTWQTFSQQIIWPPVLLLAAAAWLALAPRRVGLIALLVGTYLAVLMVFPVLYSVHAYYHVAAAFLPLVAVGVAVAGACESSRVPRLAGPILLALLLAGQAWAYAKYTYPTYARTGNRGSLATALEEILRPYECLVIAGDDWSPILPYYSQRRALLIRASLSSNTEYLRAAFAAMRSEDVGALVLFDYERANTGLLELAVREFNLEAEPTMFWDDRGRQATIYFSRTAAHDAFVRFRQNENRYHRLTLANRPPPPHPLAGREEDYASLPRRHQELFAGVTPRPARFFATFGPAVWGSIPQDWQFSVHPDTRLWFELPPGRHSLHTSISLGPATWENLSPTEATDGVEVVAAAVLPDGRREILHRRLVDPARNPADRGVLPIDWALDLPPGARLEFSVNAGPTGNTLRDWAAIGELRIR